MSFFGVCLKTSCFGVYSFNENELHIPAPPPEEGVAYTCLSLHCISAAINTAGRCNKTESGRTGVQPYIWESKWTESGTKQRNVTEHARGSMDWAVLPNESRTKKRHKLISQARRWSVKKYLMYAHKYG